MESQPTEVHIPSFWLQRDSAWLEARRLRCINDMDTSFFNHRDVQEIRGQVLWLEDRIKYVKTLELISNG